MDTPSSPPDRIVKRRNKKGSACTYCRQLKVERPHIVILQNMTLKLMSSLNAMVLSVLRYLAHDAQIRRAVAVALLIHHLDVRLTSSTLKEMDTAFNC
jgi:ABC-type phosphonate transport system ATPase subunit